MKSRVTLITIFLAFCFVLIPLLMSCNHTSGAAYIKEAGFKEQQHSLVINNPVLTAGEFHCLDITLTDEAQRISIIAYKGDIIPDVQNRSIKNYYRWEYDNGKWLDKSGYKSSYIRPSQCKKNGYTYSFYIGLDARADTGDWTIKISVDNKDVYSNSLNVETIHFNILLFTIYTDGFKLDKNDLTEFLKKHRKINHQERTVTNKESLEDIEAFIDHFLGTRSSFSQIKAFAVPVKKTSLYDELADKITKDRPSAQETNEEEEIRQCYEAEKTIVVNPHLKVSTKGVIPPPTGKAYHQSFFSGGVAFWMAFLLISLAFIPLITSSDVSIDGISPVISSFTLSPDRVVNGDTIFLNVTVCDNAGIFSVSADMGGIESISLSLSDNSTEEQLWQGMWVVHNASVGEYFATIRAFDAANTLYSAQVGWCVLLEEEELNASGNESSDINVTDDSMVNETFVDGNFTQNQIGVYPGLNITLGSNKGIYFVNETVVIQGNISYNGSLMNASVTLVVVGPGVNDSVVLNATMDGFRYEFVPVVAGEHVVVVNVSYENLTASNETRFIVEGIPDLPVGGGDITFHRILDMPLKVAALISRGEDAQVIIHYKEGSNFTEETMFLESVGFVKTAEISSRGFVAGIMSPVVYENIKYDSDISAVYPDINFTVFLSESLPLIRYYEAVEEFGVAGSGKRICILDTGVDGSLIDYSYGYDFVNDDNIPDDENGHGTKVASVIKAVAPNAELIVAKVIGASGVGYESDVLEALQWCIEQNPDVISFSIGSEGTCGGFCDSDFVASMCDDAVDSGIFVVAASGNDGSKNLRSPACGSKVFSVGATDDNDNIASFSNVNPTLDMFAPGVDITTVAETSSGTSMSAPFIAGAALLVLEQEDLNISDLTYRLRSTGKPIRYTYNDSLSIDIGRLDIFNALSNNKTMEPYDYSWWWQGFLGEKEEYQEVNPVADNETQPYFYQFSDGYGSFGKYVLNPEYCKQWLKDNFFWRLQASNDNSTWYDANQFLKIDMNWNDTTYTAKLTLTLNTTNAPRALYYRFDLACNASMKEYFNESTISQWNSRVPVGDRDMNVYFNWSDIKPLIQSGKVFFKHGIKTVGEQDYFWFRIQTRNKIPVGTIFVIDPTYGLIADAVTDSWEYDEQEGRYPDMIRLGTSEYYAIVSTGDTGTELDGYIRTIRVWNNNGTIQTSLVGSLEYSTNDSYYPSICLVSGDIYAISYYDKTASIQTIVTVNIWSSNGSVGGAVIDKQKLTYNTVPGLKTILNMGNDIFAVVYTQATTTDLWLETWQIRTNGAITNTFIDSVEIDGTDGVYPDMCKVDSDTVAVIYDAGTGGGNDGYLLTRNITAGDIASTNASKWEFDTLKCGTPTIAKVAGNIFMIAYENTLSDLYVNTTTISDTGAMTKIWIDTQAIDTTNGDYPTFFNVSVNAIANKWIKGITFSGEGSDGYVSTFDVDSTGAIGSEIDTLEFDATNNSWYAPTCYVDGFYYLTVYEGTGNDGWSCTYQIYANNPPTISNPSPANGATDVSLTPQLSVDVSDFGDYLNATWSSNSSGAWHDFGWNRSLLSYGAIRDSVVSSYEYNRDSGSYPDAIKLGSDSTYSYYAIVNAGNGNDGWINTTKVWNNNGTIYPGNVDSYEYDSSDGYCPSIVHVSGNIYAIAYGDNPVGSGKETVVTVSITSLGDIDTGTGVKDILLLTNQSSSTGSCKIINVIKNIYAVAYEQGLAYDLILDTIWINNSGTINNSVLNTLVVDKTSTSSGINPDMIMVDSDTLAILYSQRALNNREYLVTYNITSSGIITKTAANSWQIYTAVSTPILSGNCIKSIGNNIFVVSYTNSANGGTIATCTIANTGMITQSFISSYTIDTTCGYSYFTSIGNNLYALTYQGQGVSPDGFIKTLKITDAGILNFDYDSLEFDTADSIYYAPILPVANDYYLIVYEGTLNDGWSCTVKIGNDTTTTLRQTNANFSAAGTKYYWRVNVSDGVNQNYSIYNFTTDGTPPISSVDAITPYWKTTTPQTLTGTASDTGSGVKNVTLYYRYSSNNASWGGWVSAGVDTASPWSWSFSFSNGTGHYQFYSIAIDNATNAESAPGGNGDQGCGYDNQAPSSSVSAISPYWKTTTPQTLTGTASDTGSGLKNVTLYYCYRATNASSWGGWVGSGLVDSDPWVAVSWNFTFSNGTGHYQFYSIARDNATNSEIYLGSADASCGYDNAAPSSSVTAITPYWKTTTPLTITATATDATSGVKNVTLYYRFSSDNSSWGANTSAGVDTASPWSWSFDFSTKGGAGYYRFYSIACDNATNTESSPGGIGDTKCGYDNVAPSSSVDAILPYINTTGTVELTATASDALSGVKNVTLWYKYSTDNSSWGSWTQNITDTDYNWNWTYTFPNGTGYYEFYSRAYDNATNNESAPGAADARCRYTAAVPNVAPVINSYNLLNITGSKLNSITGLLDVNNEYYFTVNITDENGWSDIGYINITAWYDNGSESTTYNQTGNKGGNLNMFLQYANTSGTGTFSMKWPDDEAELISGNCTETTINSTTRVINISFKPKSQVRYANTTGGWDTTQNATNDLNSWNFNITVVDNSSAKAWKIDEYGVYRYTFIEPNQNWVGVIAAPGENDTSDVVAVTYSSNYNFNMTIWFTENLANQTKGTTILIANNVDILNDTDPNDDINTGDITFNGIGEANAVDIFNTSGIFSKNNVSQTVDVQFNVRIPIGTMWGVYTVHISVKIFQKT